MTGVLKAKVSGEWVNIGVTGPPGPMGPTGATGATGPTGPVDTAAINAHIAAADPHAVYLTAGEGDAAYVNVGGDTMTGALTIANSGEALRLRDGGTYMTWFHGGTRYGYAQGNSNGVILASESGLLRLNGVGGVNLSPATINGYTLGESHGGYRIVCTTVNGYINGNYINMSADVGAGFPAYLAGQNGDNYLRWYNKSGSWGGTFTATQCRGTNNAIFYTDVGCRTDPGAGWAAMSLHPGSIAVTLGATGGSGNTLFVRDYTGNWNSGNVAAANFSPECSYRWKKNINPYPLPAAGASVPRVSDAIARLKPVTFEPLAPDTEVPSTRRGQAYQRLNRLRAAKGLDAYELPEHDCSVHECSGDAENLCGRALNHRRMLHGFIAEDVYEVFPDVVRLDEERLPAGIDINQLLAISIAAIKELTERIKVLEGERPVVEFQIEVTEIVNAMQELFPREYTICVQKVQIAKLEAMVEEKEKTEV